MPAAWESAPLVNDAPSGTGKAAWESAPLVEESAPQATQEAPAGRSALGEPLQTPERTGFGGGALDIAQGMVEAPLSAVTGLGASVVGGYRGIADYLQGATPEERAKTVEETQQKYTYQPRGAVGQAINADLSKAFGLLNVPGEILGEAGYPAAGAAATTLLQGVLPLAAPGMVRSGKGIIEAATPAVRQAVMKAGRAVKQAAEPYINAAEAATAARRERMMAEAEARASRLSMGAAETPELAMVRASIDQAPAPVQQALAGVPLEEVNTTALERHAKAQSLPVPVPLTKGMATADSALFSEEVNLRARLPALAERKDQYPHLFQQNIEAIRDQVAPDIYGRPTDNMLGKEAIKLYKTFDTNSKNKISNAYDAIKTALGGRPMLVDSASIAASAIERLKAERVPQWVTKEVQAELDDFATRGQIPFDEIEKSQTILGRAIKGYENSGKGNEAYATGIVLREIANMPLVGEVGEIKTLANIARNLATTRFDLIGEDPAYKSVVRGTARADKFADKHIINAGGDGVARFLKTLEGTDADQVAKLAILKHLDDKTGTMTFSPGDRSQSISMTSKGYGNAFANLSDSGVLEIAFTPEELNVLQNLGDVMSYTQRTGSGGHVSYSNTPVAASSGVFQEQVGAAGAQAADAALTAAGIPAGVVKFGKGVISTIANRKFVKDSLEPMAGIRKGKPETPSSSAPSSNPPAAPGMTPKGRGQRGAITLGGVQKQEPTGTAPTLSQLPENQKLGQTLIGKKQRGSIRPLTQKEKIQNQNLNTPKIKPRSELLTVEDLEYGTNYLRKLEKLLEKLTENNGPLFIRWSPTAERDLRPNPRSRDFVSGELHSGLSGVEITKNTHYTDLANALGEYGFLRMQNKNSVPRIYSGERVGIDSDGHATFIPKKLIDEVPDWFVNLLDRRLAKAIQAQDSITTNMERLKKITDPYGKEIVLNSLETQKEKLKNYLKEK